RPYTLDYIGYLFSDFEELHGDRHFADDPAIVGGVARLDGSPVMVIGHQKGREVREKVRRNFGMPRPEGYRKAFVEQDKATLTGAQMVEVFAALKKLRGYVD
ncbi:hypothetical protein ACM6PT_37675, partial [Klebsiella pneumoniae]